MYCYISPQPDDVSFLESQINIIRIEFVVLIRWEWGLRCIKMSGQGA